MTGVLIVGIVIGLIIGVIVGTMIGYNLAIKKINDMKE